MALNSNGSVIVFVDVTVFKIYRGNKKYYQKKGEFLNLVIKMFYYQQFQHTVITDLCIGHH